ncbi:hypothetical protein QCQ60_005132 [Bacillus cereus]|nr:hypothetical protein [Bacillus cereus]
MTDRLQVVEEKYNGLTAILEENGHDYSVHGDDGGYTISIKYDNCFSIMIDISDYEEGCFYVTIFELESENEIEVGYKKTPQGALDAGLEKIEEIEEEE